MDARRWRADRCQIRTWGALLAIGLAISTNLLITEGLAAQADSLSQPADSTSLSAMIEAFLTEPIKHGTLMPEILKSVNAGPHDVEVFLSAGVLPWMCRPDSNPDRRTLRGLLLGAFVAGNAREQLMLAEKGDQTYAGVLAVIVVYEKIRQRVINFTEPEVDEWIKLRAHGLLRAHVDSVVANPPC